MKMIFFQFVANAQYIMIQNFSIKILEKNNPQSPAKLVAIKVSKFFQLYVSKYRAPYRGIEKFTLEKKA